MGDPESQAGKIEFGQSTDAALLLVDARGGVWSSNRRKKYTPEVIRERVNAFFREMRGVDNIPRGFDEDPDKGQIGLRRAVIRDVVRNVTGNVNLLREFDRIKEQKAKSGDAQFYYDEVGNLSYINAPEIAKAVQEGRWQMPDTLIRMKFDGKRISEVDFTGDSKSDTGLRITQMGLVIKVLEYNRRNAPGGNDKPVGVFWEGKGERSKLDIDRVKHEFDSVIGNSGKS